VQSAVITNIIESSVEESTTLREQIRRFKVMTEDGQVLKLVRDDEGNWHLEG